jgi:hypothetical protein
MTKTAITLSAMLLASASLAQPGAGGAGPGGGMPTNEVIMERNDANGDGEITQAEATAAETQLGQMFGTFDLNSDGKVVASELDTMRGQMAGAGPGAPPAAPAPAPAADEDGEEDEE